MKKVTNQYKEPIVLHLNAGLALGVVQKTTRNLLLGATMEIQDSEVSPELENLVRKGYVKVDDVEPVEPVAPAKAPVTEPPRPVPPSGTAPFKPAEPRPAPSRESESKSKGKGKDDKDKRQPLEWSRDGDSDEDQTE